MRKKMYVEVIEPKSIALTKKQDKWVITYVERDESGDDRQERAFFVDVKINPPREKFLIVRYKIHVRSWGYAMQETLHATIVTDALVAAMDRGLNKHSGLLLDSDKATFVQLADE